MLIRVPQKGSWKRTIASAVTVIVFISLTTAGHVFDCRAQGRESGARYGKPTILSLNKLIKSRYSEFYHGEEEWQGLLIENFYPIGWSKDGKFAYLTEPPDEGCDCYFANLIIQDMRSDKPVWMYNHRGEMEKTETLGTFWRAHRALFSRKLREHKIIANARFTLLDSQFDFNGDRLITQLTTEKEENSEYDGTLKHVLVQLVSERWGRKIIYEKRYKPEDYNPLLASQVFGVLRSPYEPRAAFILVEVNRGWEGPPHVTEVNIIGANLTTGFP